MLDIINNHKYSISPNEILSVYCKSMYLFQGKNYKIGI